MNKKISEIVKRGKTIFKSKIKWILALVLLTGCIYGSYTLRGGSGGGKAGSGNPGCRTRGK